MNGWKCDVCRTLNGSFRAHCYFCGATHHYVFWLYDGPNTWLKSKIDIDRPIHRCSNSIRDVKVQNLQGGLSLVDDPYLLAAREIQPEG